jgi:hypothetical protein
LRNLLRVLITLAFLFNWWNPNQRKEKPVVGLLDHSIEARITGLPCASIWRASSLANVVLPAASMPL